MPIAAGSISATHTAGLVTEPLVNGITRIGVAERNVLASDTTSPVGVDTRRP